MENLYLPTIFALLMVMKCSYCYFIDFNKFVSVDESTIGTIVKTNGNVEKTYYFGRQPTYQSSTNQFSRRNLQQI